MQKADAAPDHLIRFGVFELHTPTGELRSKRSRVKLQDQPLQVLLAVLEKPGEVVTREELRAKLWAADTFVDFDHGLNAAVRRLRDALGDTAESPRYIETLPRRGYRFIGNVDDAAPPTALWSAPKGRFETPWVKAIWISVGVTLVLLSGIAIWRFSRRTPESPVLMSEVLPLTGLAGIQAYPAFSPDGNQVAFVIEGEQNPGIYTTIVDGEKPLQLTSTPADSSPTWSPDGRQIAFTRYGYDGKSQSMSICVVPALGGTVRKLYTFPYSPTSTSEWVSWSPDGKVLAFTEKSRIQLFSIADSTARPLTSPPDQFHDYGAAFSPDGKRLAFVRGTVAGLTQGLFVVPATGGEAKRLTFDNREMFGPPAWTGDGHDIVFSSSRRGLVTLWRISVSGGEPRPVAGVVMASAPSISSKGDLAYVHQVSNDNIWRISLNNQVSQQGSPMPIISAKWGNFRPHFSPDGKRIAFESDRSGYWEIWTCDSDGSNCGQVTSLHGVARAARWSPDGRYIAFEFSLKEHSEVYVVEVPGGMPRLIPTYPGADNGDPNWSRDGGWIYFNSDRGGRFNISKVPLNGGSPVEVTRNGGVFAADSSDGRFLYYSKFEEAGIWKMPLSGGEETQVLDQPGGWDSYSWALVPNGIYFLNSEAPHNNIEFLRFATVKKSLIASVDSSGFGLAVSPDGRFILFVKNELAESSIMLVKNFR